MNTEQAYDMREINEAYRTSFSVWRNFCENNDVSDSTYERGRKQLSQRHEEELRRFDPNPYGVFNVFKYSTVDKCVSPYDSARSALRNVQRTLDENDSDVMEDLSAIDNRKLLRRLNVETGEEIVPRLANLCQNFDSDFAQFHSDPATWIQAHHGMDFESYWDMLYRTVSIAEQGYVEY